MNINLPTALTLLRIAMIPLMVVTHYMGHPLVTAIIFGLAGLTDWADGYYARKLNQESRLGAFLDPVADKLMVVVALLLIVEREAEFWVTLAAIAIVGREVIISALREWMAEVGQRGKVAVAFIGKVKTTAQIIALIFLLYNQPLFGVIPIRELGLIALAIATALTLISMVQYLMGAFKGMNNE
ncbi:MAG TPA: CDP-diacylglycerol--glycerol-3-phosphate 3-phosphatidyltransferase [Thiothrix sp.]|nr:CDP-diacylglycerol--glycerol-3-phosphate 3-phosphatidyltransferase [Thiothrix sp.]